MKNISVKRKTINGIIISFLVLVLVFVGVSTATYAWYSAINRALGDSITFTSSTHDQLGSELAIGWTKDSTLNELEFDAPKSSLYPMIPKTKATLFTTTYYDFITNNFNYSTQSFDNDLHAFICSIAGQNTTPFICKGTVDETEHDYFYLINKKTNEKQSITARYTIDGELASFLRIALFVGDENPTGDDRENLRLYGILSNTDVIHYSTIQERDLVEMTPVMDDVHKESGTIKFTLNENQVKVIALVAWLDGVMLQNEDAEKNTAFSILFDGIVGDIV
ncbi:MAG: hypothetical protein GX242_02430 [Clostridiales bacterium]|nr:hypothetical protein [Clostridiales bacterium]